MPMPRDEVQPKNPVYKSALIQDGGRAQDERKVTCKRGLCLSPAADGTPILSYVALMFFEPLGEAVMPLVVADEVKVIGMRWMHRREQGVLSRICNWSGG